jgi:dTDP-4-dehydrorhamnose reductase
MTAGAARRPLRPVILGSDGSAGRALVRVFESVAPATVAATRLEMDVTDEFALRWELERLEADLVINAAALADVDACEAQPEDALRINAAGAGHAGRATRAVGARFVHLSCDLVFDGRKGAPYLEEDRAAPLSACGRSKWEGEEEVRAIDPSALVVRTAWLFGGEGRRPDLARRVLAAAAGGARRVPAARDRVGSPTHVEDLARGVLLLLDAGATGTVHVAGSGAASRAEFARAVLHLAGHDGGQVEEVEAAALHEAAPSPADARLDTSRYTRLTGERVRNWREALLAGATGGAGAAG